MATKPPTRCWLKMVVLWSHNVPWQVDPRNRTVEPQVDQWNCGKKPIKIHKVSSPPEISGGLGLVDKPINIYFIFILLLSTRVDQGVSQPSYRKRRPLHSSRPRRVEVNVVPPGAQNQWLLPCSEEETSMNQPGVPGFWLMAIYEFMNHALSLVNMWVYQERNRHPLNFNGCRTKLNADSGQAQTKQKPT